MENTLKCLFDFQRFERNAALEAVIGEVHGRYAARELSLDEMDLIAAAGTPEKKTDKKDK